MSKKFEIYEAAAKLFQQKGYAATSMREIAELVELQVSSLYSHIESKQEILEKICFDNAQNYLSGLTYIEKHKGNSIEKIDAIIKMHIHLALADSTSVTVFNNEWRHLDKVSLDKFLQMRQDYEFRIENIIKMGISQNILKNIPITILLNTLLSSLKWLHYTSFTNTKEMEAELHQHISLLLLKGIRK